MAAEADNLLNINLGILGHVDSGKTSLARALSTVISTASMDRNPQSVERGITNDLGFSGFKVPMPDHLKDSGYSELQYTIVDCPGHASLIKTVIGGAQIIDMMLLVMDINKGMQTQTAEGLVIGEITCENMIVVLNKLDLIPAEERAKKIEKMTKKIRKVLESSRFPNAPIVCLAANPGAAGDLGTRVGESGEEPLGIPEFLSTLASQTTIPRRTEDDTLLFAIDHCFLIKGKGTIMTGTVLAGQMKVGQTIELPALQMEKKVKSMQMFHKPVQVAKQGDRVGVCVTQVDPSLLERGLASSPGAVHTNLRTAIASVEKIKYYRQDVLSQKKFHITVGHTTVMARIRFFGCLPQVGGDLAPVEESDRGFLPHADFDFSQDYIDQPCLYPAKHVNEDGVEELRPRGSQYVLLEFESPVVCPKNCAIIGAKLDADHQNYTPDTKMMRLAFHGRLLTDFDMEHKSTLRIYTPKLKEAPILRITDEYNVIGKDLFSKGTPVALYQGLKVESSVGGTGVIEGSFGSGNKFKVFFPEGGQTDKRATLILRFKRFVFDPEKRMQQ